MATQTLPPDAVLDSTNYTTLILGDIDEDPDSPDASYGTWDGNGNTICRTSFGTPTGPPTVGADLQEFRVRIRQSASHAGLGWSLQLRENGAQVSVLATGTLTTATVVSGTWNASALGTADGSLVECRLEQTSGGTGGGRQGIEVGAVEWNATYSQSVMVTPGTASLGTAAFAPTVTATDNKTATPGTAALALTAFAPSVGVSVTAIPGTAALSLTPFAPTVSVSDHKTVTPGTLAFVLSAFESTVTVTNSVLVTPAPAALSIATFAPTVTASGGSSGIPGLPYGGGAIVGW